MNHEAGPENIQIVARVADLKVRGNGATKRTEKIGSAALGCGRPTRPTSPADIADPTAGGPVHRAAKRNFPTDIFSTDKYPTEIRDHHSKRAVSTLHEVVPVRSSVDPGDARSVGTKNASETSQLEYPLETFPRKCLGKRLTRNRGPAQEQTVKIGPSDAVAGNIGPTGSR